MPGRQHAPALTPGPRLGPARGRGTLGAVLVRALAVLAVATGVAVAVGLTSWTAGRASVDREGLLAEGRAEGRAEVLAAMEARAARDRGAEGASSVGARLRTQRIYRRGWRDGRAQGVSKTSFEQRAHGRMLGAKAALGGFAGGWAPGGWYVVQVGGGSTLTGGQPAVTRRVGPLGTGERYSVCGGRICRAPAAR
jgi:hypothetical protein